jgi:hypothetical protein
MSSISRTKTYIDKNESILSIPQLETRLGLLENYFKQFMDVQDQIDLLDESEVKEDVREKYEDAFCYCKSKILSLISTKNKKSNTLHSQTSF